MSVVKAPRILLPSANTDLSRWAVLACDQYTSEPEYWHQLAAYVGPSPSTLQLIFPEAFLNDDPDARIQKINRNMAMYLAHGVLRDVGECFILVDRQTPFKPRRLGLVIAIDLEEYSPDPHSEALVRGTEKTVPARIPPRMHIRANASLEVPHILLLMDDSRANIIEKLYAQKSRFPVLYDFDLNMGGGHLTGYQINDTKPVIRELENLIEPHRLLFAVGDGNHSLAAAKGCWEAIKPSLSGSEQEDHPARFALVELENIFDPGLSFEPIHRVVFNVTQDFLDGLSDLSQGDAWCLTYTKKGGTKPYYLPENAPEAVLLLQNYIDAYLEENKFSSVDYVHGLESMKAVCQTDPFAIGITLPPLNKADLVDYVSHHGVLPRKTFSMGEAAEKRYYMECRKIIK
ncbi:MAG: DUF1015 domain-containing protein [bacterium]